MGLFSIFLVGSETGSAKQSIFLHLRQVWIASSLRSSQ
jgi:hypothetical protein